VYKGQHFYFLTVIIPVDSISLLTLLHQICLSFPAVPLEVTCFFTVVARLATLPLIGLIATFLSEVLPVVSGGGEAASLHDWQSLSISIIIWSWLYSAGNPCGVLL